MRRVALALLALAIWSAPASAKTLYVNNSGSPACSDSTTYANNDIANPWCTIGRAAWGNASRSSPSTTQAAQQGDLVLVNSGTYNVGAATGSGLDPTLRPVNSGASGSPITFRGFLLEPFTKGSSADSVILRHTGDSFSGTGGPIIGVDDDDYVTWEGFFIDEANAHPAPDKGPIVFHDCIGCKAQYNEIKGMYAEWPGCNVEWPNPGDTYFRASGCDDNHNGIRLEKCRTCLIANNRIYEIGSSEENGPPDVPLPDDNDFGQNDAAIMTYDSDGSTIEHNDLERCGVGVFIKGDHLGDGWVSQNNIVRFNYVHDMQHAGIRIIDGLDDRIYQNLIVDTLDEAGTTNGVSGTGASSNIWLGHLAVEGAAFFNNTVIGGAYCVNLQQAGAHINIELKNNLCSATTYALVSSVTTGADPTTEHHIDRNVYSGVTSNIASTPTGGEDNFAQWQAAFSNRYDQNSSNATVTFQSGTYKLAANGQAALTTGRVIYSIGGTNGDTIPVGAYITGNETIGLDGVSGGGVAGGRSRSRARHRSPDASNVLPRLPWVRGLGFAPRQRHHATTNWRNALALTNTVWTDRVATMPAGRR